MNTWKRLSNILKSMNPKLLLKNLGNIGASISVVEANIFFCITLKFSKIEIYIYISDDVQGPL